jgi:CheY-like chemotaxis protein
MAAARRVLVVDDNISATEALALILDCWGHAVRVCHDGPSGLDAASEFRPDVVILDIDLPGLDGHAVARRLRERPEHQAVVMIAMTGHDHAEARDRSHAVGINVHMVKPINLNALETLLADSALDADRTATER